MKAVIFDFDGTILDTEQTELAAWQFIYNEYNCIVPLDRWCKRIGAHADIFDPINYLEQLINTKLDIEKIHKQRRKKLLDLVADLQPLPGILQWISAANRLGIKLAIASSSPRYWVESHLKRVNLIQYFDVLVTGDDVKNLKPNPEIYQLVLTKMQVTSNDALAIEDSPNGALAALSAGIQCIVVPNKLTEKLSFPSDVSILRSLDKHELENFLKLNKCEIL